MQLANFSALKCSSQMEYLKYDVDDIRGWYLVVENTWNYNIICSIICPTDSKTS